MAVFKVEQGGYAIVDPGVQLWTHDGNQWRPHNHVGTLVPGVYAGRGVKLASASAIVWDPQDPPPPP